MKSNKQQHVKREDLLGGELLWSDGMVGAVVTDGEGRLMHPDDPSLVNVYVKTGNLLGNGIPELTIRTFRVAKARYVLSRRAQE